MLAKITVIIAGALMLPLAARAQADYPSKPVRIMVASTAGGPLDIVTRNAANWWQKQWGQAFIVENKPGASGIIAVDAVMREAPDGYTLLSTTSGISATLAGMKSAPYSVTRDFAPVGIICGGGVLLTTSTTLPVKTIEALVQYVKSNPGKINFGEPGVLSADVEDLFSRLGIRDNIVHVRYKGGGPAQAAALSGEVHLILGQESLVKNNPEKVRAIAYTGGARYPGLPDVPTIAETVLPGYRYTAWLGFLARAGVPMTILRKLNSELLEFQKTPTALAAARNLNFADDVALDVESMRQLILSEAKKMDELVARGIIVRE